MGLGDIGGFNSSSKQVDRSQTDSSSSTNTTRDGDVFSEIGGNVQVTDHGAIDAAFNGLDSITTVAADQTNASKTMLADGLYFGEDVTKAALDTTEAVTSDVLYSNYDVVDRSLDAAEYIAADGLNIANEALYATGGIYSNYGSDMLSMFRESMDFGARSQNLTSQTLDEVLYTQRDTMDQVMRSSGSAQETVLAAANSAINAAEETTDERVTKNAIYAMAFVAGLGVILLIWKKS